MQDAQLMNVGIEVSIPYFFDKIPNLTCLVVDIDAYYHRLSVATFNYPLRGTSLRCCTLQHGLIDGIIQESTKNHVPLNWNGRGWNKEN